MMTQDEIREAIHAVLDRKRERDIQLGRNEPMSIPTETMERLRRQYPQSVITQDNTNGAVRPQTTLVQPYQPSNTQTHIEPQETQMSYMFNPMNLVYPNHQPINIQTSPNVTLEWRGDIHNGSLLPNGDHDLVLRTPKPSTPNTLEEGIKLYRFGTKENGLIVEVYPDGTWSHTLIKNGKFVSLEG